MTENKLNAIFAINMVTNLTIVQISQKIRETKNPKDKEVEK